MVEKLDNTYFLQLIDGLKYDEENDLYLFNGKSYKYKGGSLLSESRKRYAHYFMNAEDIREIIYVTSANDIPLYDGFNQIKVDRTLREKCLNRFRYSKYILPKQKINAEIRQAWKEELKKQKELEKEELRKKKQKELEKKLEPKECAFCGKVFKPTQPPQRFCCTECRIKYFSRKQGIEATEARQHDIKCVVCGTEFRGTPRQKYCSAKCRNKYRAAMEKAKREALKSLQKEYQK